MSTEEKNTDETSRTIAASNGKNNWESRGNESLSTKEGKVLREQNSLMVKILSVFAIVAGILLIVLSQTGPESWGQFARDLFLAIGLAIAPSGLIGLITDYLIFGRTMETLVDEVKQFGTENNKLSEQVKALQVSTEFLKQSSELGLEMIYPDRGSALKFFANLMRKQAKSESKEQSGRLIIVGSSIKGLREAIRNLEDIITEASKNPYCDFRILLTHPQYCRYRENQEERPPGAIEEEIYATMLLLEDNWFKSDDENKSSTPMESRMESDGGKNNKEINKSIAHNVKLYKGTPTCFMIIAGDHMLINPYPYEKEAFKSFCLLVRELNKPRIPRKFPKVFINNSIAITLKRPGSGTLYLTIISSWKDLFRLKTRKIAKSIVTAIFLSFKTPVNLI